MPPEKEKKKKSGITQNTQQVAQNKQAMKTKPASFPSGGGINNAKPSAPAMKTPEEKEQEKLRKKEEARKAKEEKQKLKEDQKKAKAEKKAKAANEKMMRKEAEKKEKERQEEERRKKVQEQRDMTYRKEMGRANFDNMVEFTKKKQLYDEKKEEHKGKLDEIRSESEKMKNSKISHTSEMRDNLASQKKKMALVEDWYQQIFSSSILYQSPQLENELEELKTKKKGAQEVLDAADKKVTKYGQYRDEYDTEAQNERLMRFISKIARQNGAASASSTPTVQPRSAAGLIFDNVQEVNETIEEFYGDHLEVFENASNNIQSIIHTGLDIGDKLGDAGETSGTAFKGFFSFFGAIKAGFSAWNTFTRMHKRDQDRAARGEKKDSADRWQDARLAMEKIADVLTGVLGAVGSVIGTGPGAILGIISNCIVLFMKFVSIADSSARIHGINNRKSKLWAELEEKRKKYAAEENPGPEVDAYNMHGLTRASAIKKKRDQLRETLSGSEYKMGEGVAIAEKQAMPAGVKYRKVTQNFGEGYTSLSDKIVQEQAWAQGKNFKAGSEEQKKYKTRVRMMKALELVERYYEEDQAQDRQIKLLSHSIEDSIVESADMVGNLADLSVVGAGAGKIVNVVAASYKLIRGTGSKIRAEWHKRNGHANDKKFVRDEMAKTMYQSIAGMLTKDYGWDGSTFNGDQVENFRLRSAAGRMRHVRGMMTGLDLHMDPLMQSANKEEFVNSLSSAFSQDGNG